MVSHHEIKWQSHGEADRWTCHQGEADGQGEGHQELQGMDPKLDLATSRLVARADIWLPLRNLWVRLALSTAPHGTLRAVPVHVGAPARRPGTQPQEIR